MKQMGKREEKRERGRFLRKTFAPLAAALLISLAALSVAVYAAFVSNGSAKGVLVHRELNFNSNILQPYTTGSVEDLQYTTPDRATVYIRNFNPNNGGKNNFDITYTLTYWLATTTDVDDSYTIEYDGVTRPVTGTPASLTMTLSADTAEEDVLLVRFQDAPGVEQVKSDTAVIITAVPTSPAFMRSHKLGAAISKDTSVGRFSVRGVFVEPSESSTVTSTDAQAGFKYMVSCTGAPEGKRIQLSWNANKLELDPYNKLLNDMLTATPGDVPAITITDGAAGWKIMTVDPESYRFFYVSFYRADGWTAADSDAALLRSWVVTSAVE